MSNELLRRTGVDLNGLHALLLSYRDYRSSRVREQSASDAEQPQLRLDPSWPARP